MDRIDIDEKLSQFNEYWSPRIIAEANGQHVKLARLEGDYVWHAHPDADEVFLVLKGRFTMEFRDRVVELDEGQMIVVPRTVEHRPVEASDCVVLLVEPVGTVSTGDAEPNAKSTEGSWI